MLKWLLVAAVIWAAWKLLRPGTRPMPKGRVDRREATALLGVPHDADEPTIREAHRRKVASVHPDRGGSDEATRALNAARDLLLADRR